MVRFGSIRVSGPLSGEHILGVGSGMGPDCSVRVSGIESVLPGLEAWNDPLFLLLLAFVDFLLLNLHALLFF